MFDHVGIVVADLTTSRILYSNILSRLGYQLISDNSEDDDDGWLVYSLGDDEPFFVVAVGRPSFWRSENSPSQSPIHCAFSASSKSAVDQFHMAGLVSGATDNGAPGERSPGYYAAYLIDPDGNNIEAAFRENKR